MTSDLIHLRSVGNRELLQFFVLQAETSRNMVGLESENCLLLIMIIPNVRDH